MKKKFLMLCMILTALLFLCTLTACDKTDPNVEVPEHEHTLGEWQEVLAPTCSTQGVRAKLCTVAGCRQFELELIDSLGHTMGEWTLVKEATCTEAGEESSVCQVCGLTETRAIPATGHTYTPQVVPPTCTEDGCTTYMCHCWDLYREDYVPATGH